ncbi:MAG: hypothetical protein ACP5MZ_00975 [Candidatus Micrarchaeia archaeon]
MNADNIHMDSKLSVYYMSAAFAYLVVGSVLFLISLSGFLPIRFDYIFIMWFFGFVMMMIFGLSYMFAPGLSHSGYANYKTVEAELIVLNFGILLFLGSELAGLKEVALFGAIAIFAGILIHVYNMSYMFSKKGRRIRQ